MSDPALESSIARLAEIARREGGISAIEQGSDLWEHIRLASVTPGGGMYIWHRFIWSDIPPDRNRMTWRTHGPITLALEDRSIKRLWIEYPRRTLKTTLVSHAYPAWELCRLVIEPPHDPWWRFFFMSDTITNAQRLYEGVRLGHDRPKFKFFFPELAPPRNGYRRPGDLKPFKWNESEGEIIREYRTAEPTYTPIAAKKVGPHYEVGILDDLINSENYDSPSAVEKAIDFYKFAVNLLEDYHENRLIGVGNSWNIGDLNEHIHKEAHRTGMVILSVSAETGPNFDGDHACKNLPEPIRELMKRIPAPAWPERFDEEALAALRVEMGPRIYSAQMLNNPVDPEVTEFDESLVRECVLTKHPMYDDIRALKLPNYNDPIPLDELSLYVSWDPALDKNSRTRVSKKSENAVTVTFVTVNGEVGVLEEFSEICSPYTAMDHFLTYCRRYQGLIRGAVMDEVLFQQVLKDLLRDRLKELELHAPLRKVKIPRMLGGKDARIRAWLSHYISKGKFHVERSCSKTRRQIRQFGIEGAKRDLLDSIAIASKIWRRPTLREELIRRKRLQKMSCATMGLTGYGRFTP